MGGSEYDAEQAMSGASWMLYILPFMEHHDIFDHWDLTHSVAGSAASKLLAKTEIKEFYCPSAAAAGCAREMWSSCFRIGRPAARTTAVVSGAPTVG